MSEHYYTALPQSNHKPLSLSFAYRGNNLTFDTDSGVFSRTEIDRGTEVLLEALPESLNGSILDMGCGYGVIGISLAKSMKNVKITMVDINERAVALATENSKRNGVNTEVLTGDGFSDILGQYDNILINPPIRCGKALIYQLFADAKTHLKQDGKLWLVIGKKQGAPSAKIYLSSLYDSVEVVEKKSGFWIFSCSCNEEIQTK